MTQKVGGDDYRVDPHIFENTFQYSIQRLKYFQQKAQKDNDEQPF